MIIIIVVTSVVGFFILSGVVWCVVHEFQRASRRRWDIEEGKRQRVETQQRVEKAVGHRPNQPQYR